MARFDGSRPGPGRPLGSRNRISRICRENIELVFGKLGGPDAMVAWAKDHQTEFYTRVYPRPLPVEAHVVSEYLDPDRRPEEMSSDELDVHILSLAVSHDPAIRAGLDALIGRAVEDLRERVKEGRAAA